MGLATRRSNEKMNRETNETNMAINQANIDYAREAWNSEVAYNWAMFNAENEYNSARNQKARLLEAGLNPYMMMSGGSAGTASGSSAPGHNQPSMLPAQAYYHPETSAGDIFSGIQDAVGTVASAFGAYNENQLLASKVEGQNISNTYARTKYATDIARQIADIKNIDQDTKKKMLENLFDGMSLNSRVESAKLHPEFMKQQIKGVSLENAMKRANLRWVDKEKEAQINKLIAETLKTYSEKKRIDTLTPAELENIVSRTFLQNKQNWNLPIRNKADADRYSKAYISGAENAAIISGYEAGKKMYNQTTIIPFFGSPQDVENIIDILSPLK